MAHDATLITIDRLAWEIAETGELVETVILGTLWAAGSKAALEDEAPVEREVSWAEAHPWLQRRLDAFEARPFYVYTKSWIFFLHGNDDRGWAAVAKLPRHPSPEIDVRFFS